MTEPLAPPPDSLRAVIVVPARDEETRIDPCLRALACQQGVEPGSYEVIVVLDGCRDQTLRSVRAVAEQPGMPPIHVISFETSRGVGRARRTGMDLACERLVQAGARPGLICSTDADTLVAQDWLAVQLELVKGGAQAIGGQIEIDPQEGSMLHPQAIETRRQRSAGRIAEISASEQRGGSLDHPHFSGASLSLTSDAYRRCGGLPVRAALEDEELARVLTQHGVVIERSSRVRVRTSARADGRAPRGLASDLKRSDWRARRSYSSAEFSLGRLLASKRQSVSLVLPAREVAGTIATVAGVARELMEAGLFDEVLVVDSGSADGTAEIAAQAGLAVAQEDELMSAYGPALGKGDAMWRGLAATSGEIVVFADTDTEDFNRDFLLGVVGPLLCDPQVQFVKGAFERPFRSGGDVVPAGGGRVTELMARPLLNLHLPQLTVFDQPLAGETAARRSLLERLPFAAGYGVEIAMLIDCWRLVGLDAMAQVFLGTRQNRHQSLRELSAMAYAVLVTASSRVLGPEFADSNCTASMFLPPAEAGSDLIETRAVTLEERPALAELPRSGDPVRSAARE